MKIDLAIEWFINPDHLPFIVGIKEEIYKKYSLELNLIEPDAHYDGLSELKSGNIEFATNEPLHLIEQFDEKFLSLGTFFETKGGVMIKEESFAKLKNGEKITVTTPVANDKTNAIGFEIIKRFGAQNAIDVKRENVEFFETDFYHIKNLKAGYDAAWLYFYNFEGVEAKHENMKVIFMDAQTSGFANFSALDIFTNRDFYDANHNAVNNFLGATKEAIKFIQTNPKKAAEYYYEYTKTEKSPLMNDIIEATTACFDKTFESNYEKQLPVLEFFNEIKISNLSKEEFKKAFI